MKGFLIKHLFIISLLYSNKAVNAADICPPSGNWSSSCTTDGTGLGCSGTVLKAVCPNKDGTNVPAVLNVSGC